MDIQCLVLVLIQSIFFSICGLSVAYTGLKSYNYYKQKIKRHRSLWYFALTTFLCVTLSFLTAAVFIPARAYVHTINFCPFFYMIQSVLSCIFKVNLYLFFLQRIHDTFRFSLHEIQPIIINVLRFITISYWISITALECALVYPYSHMSQIGHISYCDLHQDRIEFNVDLILISDTISETILCPLILLLFIRGLYSVVSTRKNLSVRDATDICINDKPPMLPLATHSRSRSETVSEDGYDYNNKMDRNFVYAMTKFTTLANLSFITSISVYLLLLICKYCVFLHVVTSFQLAIRLVFDQWINCFCVYFVFRFTDAKYHKYCYAAHHLQICCMVVLCPSTKPMFEVAKLEYQRKKIGLKGYSSNMHMHKHIKNTDSFSQTLSAKNNNNTFNIRCEDELEIVHELKPQNDKQLKENSKTDDETMDDMVQLINFDAQSMDSDDIEQDGSESKLTVSAHATFE